MFNVYLCQKHAFAPTPLQMQRGSLGYLLSKVCLCPYPVQMQSESLGRLCQKRAFAPTPLKIKCRAICLVISFKSMPLPPSLSKCRVNHLVISFRSMPLPPPCSNAEQIIWSSRSKACLCPHPTQNQMQSESLGHICQKHAFVRELSAQVSHPRRSPVQQKQS